MEKKLPYKNCVRGSIMQRPALLMHAWRGAAHGGPSWTLRDLRATRKRNGHRSAAGAGIVCKAKLARKEREEHACLIAAGGF
eukprot:607761-Pleurochrysis_carterae.AAC.1